MYPCPLDAFDPIGGSCTAAVAIVQGLTELTRGDETRYAAVGTFDSVGGVTQLAGGLGLLFQIGDASSQGESLTYADIGPLPTGDPLPFGTPFGDAFPTEIDPTPAHLYYPLSVGDEWQTEFGSFSVANVFGRRVVVGTEVVDGESYAVVEVSSATPDAPAWVVTETRRLRFDPVSGHIVEPDGTRRTTCPLDEPFNADVESPVLCVSGDDFAGGFAAFRRDGPLTQNGGPTISTESYRELEYLGLADGVSPIRYVAGIGPVPNQEGAFFPGPYARLAYARVQQEDGSIRTLGAPLPVDAEDGAPAAALTVSAAPNPTAGALRLAVTVPRAGALRAEAFDALGRLVWSHAAEAAAGAAELAIDAGAWAPGLYVVRVQTGDAVATTRVVRR